MINRGAIEQMWKRRHKRNTDIYREENKMKFGPSYVFTFKSYL